MTSDEHILLCKEMLMIERVSEKIGVEIHKGIFNIQNNTAFKVHFKARHYYDFILPMLPDTCIIRHGMDREFNWRKDKALKNILWALSPKNEH